MKNYFNKALFFENIKRFWSVAGVGFLAFYLSGIEYIRTRVGSQRVIPYSTLKSMLQNQWFWIVIEFGLAVIAAFVVFNYLHQHKATNMIHAMPMNRTSLFITNYASGLVLCIIPIILTAIFLFIFKTPVFEGNTWNEHSLNSVDIYTVRNILAWAWQSFVYMSFTFSLTTFGLIVAGSSVIAILTGVCANFIVPAVLLCFVGFASNAYWGFMVDDQIVNFVANTTPFAMLIEINNTPELLGLFGDKFPIYFIISIIVAVLAYFLYRVRKNERVEDGYAFNIFEYLIGFLFVFIPSTIAGLGLYSEWGRMAYVYGGGVGFILGQMITRKTFRILDKKGIKNLIIFAIIMVLIVVSFNFDFFGYERKVPKLEQVDKVAVNSIALRQYQGDRNGMYSTSQEDEISTIIAFHSDIVKHKNELIKLGNDSASGGCYVTFEYKLKNGNQMMRQYYFPIDYLSSSEEFHNIYDAMVSRTNYVNNMEQLKDKHFLIDGGIYKPFEGTVEEEFYFSFTELDENQRVQLVDALMTDIKNDSHAFYIDYRGQMGHVALYVDKDSFNEITAEQIAGYLSPTIIATEDVNANEKEAYVFEYGIYEDYADTIKFLNDNVKPIKY